MMFSANERTETPKGSLRQLASSPALRRYEDIRELIANPANPTPLVRLTRVVPPGDFQLYLKLEWFNPFGSIKDRTAYFLLKGMAERGELDGKNLVEPSSGNTGIALAAIAALMHKKLVVTIPTACPRKRNSSCECSGPRSGRHPMTSVPLTIPKTERLPWPGPSSRARRPRRTMPCRINMRTRTTCGRIRNHGAGNLAADRGQVQYFLAGYGTCGTITGEAKFLKEQNPDIRVIAIEPQKGHKLPGLKNLEESKPPGILDRSLIDEVIRVNDEPAYAMTKRLFREEGLIVGPSTGAMVHAALEFAKSYSGLAVAISPDSGLKYTSYFQDILGNEGLPQV